MNTPKTPSTGEEIKAQHLADIIRWVQSLVPNGDGKTVAVSRTAGGSVITSLGGTGTALIPVLVGKHLIYDYTAQKMIYLGYYCSDFDGVFCTTWNPCYLSTIYNITEEEYLVVEGTPEIFDFPDNSIFFGQKVSYNLEYDPAYDLYIFDHPRWIKTNAVE